MKLKKVPTKFPDKFMSYRKTKKDMKEVNTWTNSYSELSDLDYIENNLWLGNLAAASNAEVLRDKKIKSILTVNAFPLSESISNSNQICIKFIKAFDSPRQDLLSYFEESHKFIKESLINGSLLVHCYHGVSRSATILASYLMKEKKIDSIAALEYLKSKRRCVKPNPGFLEQLKLYDIMNWSLNSDNLQYKMFKLYIAVDHVKKANELPTNFSNVIKPDPLLETLNNEVFVYKCKNCRRIVARGSNTVPHVPTERYSWRNPRWSDNLERSEICQALYFVEPLSWMENVASSLEGKIHCPKCKSKLGNFSWAIGCPCICGTQVCPSFYLVPSKVDLQNICKFFMKSQ